MNEQKSEYKHHTQAHASKVHTGTMHQRMNECMNEQTNDQMHRPMSNDQMGESEDE